MQRSTVTLIQRGNRARPWLLIFIAVFAIRGGPASGQNLFEEPAFGEVELESGFLPDPHVVELVSGGEDSNESLPSGCVGYFSGDRPDFALVYENSGGSLPLTFFVDGPSDTALLINGPDGTWHCNDDTGGPSGLLPAVTFNSPESGRYDVWVSELSIDTYNDVRLAITELSANWDALASVDDTGTPIAGWGDDAGTFAFDGECDDPRFGGILDNHRGHDATDCRQEAAANGTGPAPGAEPGTTLVTRGTGFFVTGMGHLLTNHHVAGACTRTLVRMLGEPPVEAALITTHAAADLTLLKVERTPGDWARFRTGSPVRQGDEIVVYGFPLTDVLSNQGNLTSGLVTALSGGPNDLNHIQLSAEIGAGNSGGPVMDRSGRIVGVIVATLDPDGGEFAPQNVNFAIRDSAVRTFLDIQAIRYETGDTESEMSIADIGERARRFTGIIECYQ